MPISHELFALVFGCCMCSREELNASLNAVVRDMTAKITEQEKARIAQDEENSKLQEELQVLLSYRSPSGSILCCQKFDFSHVFLLLCLRAICCFLPALGGTELQRCTLCLEER